MFQIFVIIQLKKRLKKKTCLDSSMVQQPALRCSGCSSSAGIRTEEEQQEHHNVACCTIELSRHVHFLNKKNTSIIVMF